MYIHKYVCAYKHIPRNYVLSCAQFTDIPGNSAVCQHKYLSKRFSTYASIYFSGSLSSIMMSAEEQKPVRGRGEGVRGGG